MPQQGAGRPGRFRFTIGAPLYRSRRASTTHVGYWKRRFTIARGVDPGGTLFADVVAGVSSSNGSLTEAAIGADAGVGVSSSTRTIAEAFVAAYGLAGSSSSSGTASGAWIGADAPSGSAHSIGTAGETWISPLAPLPIPAGLMALLYPKRERRIVYRDRPEGISHSEHELVEAWSRRGPVRRSADRSADVLEVDLEELLVLGLL